MTAAEEAECTRNGHMASNGTAPLSPLEADEDAMAGSGQARRWLPISSRPRRALGPAK
jgi:hypothetical protein